MKILTLNTWNEKGPWPERWEVIFHVISSEQPDIIGFQEIFSSAWCEKLRQKLPEYKIISFQEHSGLVFLSKWEVIQSAIRPYKTQSSEEDYLRYLIHMKIEHDTGCYDFYNTHLSWRIADGAVRLKQIQEMLEWVQKTKSVNTAFMLGDFNADARSIETQWLLDQPDIVDCFVLKHPNLPGLTWSHENPYTCSKLNQVGDSFLPERRIDYIFVQCPAKDSLNRIQNVRVIFDRPGDLGIFASDHFGLCLDWKD